MNIPKSCCLDERFLTKKISQFSDNALLVSETMRVSYGEILEQRNDFDLAQVDLVLCVIGNDIGGIKGYLSVLCSSAAVILLNENAPIENIIRIREKYRPNWIWIDSSRVSQIQDAKLHLSSDGYCLLRFNTEQKNNLNQSLKLLLQTSGSTGSPKLVRISKKNILSNASSIAEYLKLNGSDLPITTLPPSYTYGLSIIHSHLLVGASIAVTDNTFFDRGFWNFFRSVRATSFGGVPYHYEMLKKLGFTKMEFPSLRKLTQAGGKMAPELSREFATYARDRGIEYYTMYGQAEATARMSYLPPERAIKKAGSIGVPIPGGHFWLEDENGQVIQDEDVTGELIYSGPNVSMGYASSYRDLAKEDERGGILRTGDLAKRDQDGDYYIVGRLKRFIKLFGNRTNLQDVEKFLLDEGYVAACSGKDDLLEIFVKGVDLLEGEKIKKMVCSYIRVAMQGVEVFSVTEFPRNDSGKIQYGNLKPDLGMRVA